MPKTLSRACVSLSLSALSLAAVWLVTVFYPPLDIAIPRLSRLLAVEQQPGARIPMVLVVAVVQVMLCVLGRTGRNSVRVVLTVVSIFTALTALLVTVFLVLGYQDFTERAEVLGGRVQLTASGIAVIAVVAFAVVATVIGVLLLYRPTSNAYVKHVRRLTSQARSAGLQD